MRTVPVTCGARECDDEAVWAVTLYEAGAEFPVPVCRSHGQALGPRAGVMGLDSLRWGYLNEATRSLDPVARQKGHSHG